MGYSYTGPEIIIGKFRACSITSFHIEKLTLHKSMAASGSIKIMDYVENCGADHTWEAKKEEDTWTVWCTDKSGKYSRIEEDGKAAFTWEPSIDEDMKKFITEKLILFEEHQAAA